MNNKQKGTPKKHRSALLQVIKDKNKLERRARDRRNIKLKDIKSETLYSAKLVRELSYIDELLERPGIEAVIIEVSDKDYNLFTKAINRDELASYDIIQSPTEAREFSIARQQIYL